MMHFVQLYNYSAFQKNGLFRERGTDVFVGNAGKKDYSRNKKSVGYIDIGKYIGGRIPEKKGLQGQG